MTALSKMMSAGRFLAGLSSAAWMVAAAVAAVVAGAGALWFRGEHYREDLELCQARMEAAATQKILHGIEVEGLVEEIEAQNERTRRLNSATEEQRRSASEAMEALGKSRARVHQAVARLQSLQGESCEEGIALIDREFSL